MWGTTPTVEASEALTSHGHALATSTRGFFHPDTSYLNAKAGRMATPSLVRRFRCSLPLGMGTEKAWVLYSHDSHGRKGRVLWDARGTLCSRVGRRRVWCCRNSASLCGPEVQRERRWDPRAELSPISRVTLANDSNQMEDGRPVGTANTDQRRVALSRFTHPVVTDRPGSGHASVPGASPHLSEGARLYQQTGGDHFL